MNFGWSGLDLIYIIYFSPNSKSPFPFRCWLVLRHKYACVPLYCPFKAWSSSCRSLHTTPWHRHRLVSARFLPPFSLFLFLCPSETPPNSSSYCNDLPRPPSSTKDHSIHSFYNENILPTATSFTREFPSCVNHFVLSLTALPSIRLPQTITNQGHNSSNS